MNSRTCRNAQRTFCGCSQFDTLTLTSVGGEGRLGREIIATEATASPARAPVFTARPWLRSHLTIRRHVRVGVVITQVLVIVDVVGERLVGPGRVLDLILCTVDVHFPLRCVDPLHETYR